MAIQKITIQQFLQLSAHHPVLDVRSPSEYNHAHIPNAISLPLFTDEERKVVGTAYKQQSRQQAIKIGLDYFGVKMKGMVEEVEKLLDVRCTMYDISSNISSGVHLTSNIVLVHCWRGGMRSAAVAWLLDMYGFTVYTLVGGYKAYRNWVLQQFDMPYQFTIIGGFTGSGKTPLLIELQKQNLPTINLEELANHKGSAFGYVGNQPSQEMFENLLAEKLVVNRWSLIEKELDETTTNHQPPTTNFYIEDESQRIGNVKIPNSVWTIMRKSQVIFLDISFEERLKHIVEEYGNLDKTIIIENINRIQKRLGGLEAKNAINHIENKDIAACFTILLTYYDKWYLKGLNNRENLSSFLNKMPCNSVDAVENAKQVLLCVTSNV
ncbi:MAG: tRNA 2-selenouridine(34) synthase MnmH [Ferruginibacter sp.]|nr:tRNA 2-selenouridine(34) synthase MnmH [Ferruginibacter sp.]